MQRVEERKSDSLLEHVRAGLSAEPRQLSPALFYDDLGSRLFDAICELPWYPITRAEKTQLRERSAEIFDHALGAPLHIVELGPGNGEKLDILLEALAGRQAEINVGLVDISAAALETARARIAPRPGVTVQTHTGLFAEGLAELAGERPSDARTLALFLGSNIGNFTPPEAAQLLADIRGSLVSGDFLLIGADLIKDREALEQAYDDPLGLTAVFNKNLLLRLNRELDADFDLAKFRHCAVWNAAESRVEMHLVSIFDQTIRIKSGDFSVPFRAGEGIWTESSHKYTPDSLDRLLEPSGFEPVERWSADGFLSALYRAA